MEYNYLEHVALYICNTIYFRHAFVRFNIPIQKLFYFSFGKTTKMGNKPSCSQYGGFSEIFPSEINYMVKSYLNIPELARASSLSRYARGFSQVEPQNWLNTLQFYARHPEIPLAFENRVNCVKYVASHPQDTASKQMLLKILLNTGSIRATDFENDYDIFLQVANALLTRTKEELKSSRWKSKYSSPHLSYWVSVLGPELYAIMLDRFSAEDIAEIFIYSDTLAFRDSPDEEEEIGVSIEDMLHNHPELETYWTKYPDKHEILMQVLEELDQNAAPDDGSDEESE